MRDIRVSFICSPVNGAVFLAGDGLKVCEFKELVMEVVKV
jgi:hypothetical protein